MSLEVGLGPGFLFHELACQHIEAAVTGAACAERDGGGRGHGPSQGKDGQQDGEADEYDEGQSSMAWMDHPVTRGASVGGRGWRRRRASRSCGRELGRAAEI